MLIFYCLQPFWHHWATLLERGNRTKFIGAKHKKEIFWLCKNVFWKSPFWNFQIIKNLLSCGQTLQIVDSEHLLCKSIMINGTLRLMPVKLFSAECKYSTLEWKCLAIVWRMTKFQFYLAGKPFILQTDHKPLTYLNQAKFQNDRIMRWALALQGYDNKVESIPGKDNVVADYLSRIISWNVMEYIFCVLLLVLCLLINKICFYWA